MLQRRVGIADGPRGCLGDSLGAPGGERSDDAGCYRIHVGSPSSRCCHGRSSRPRRPSRRRRGKVRGLVVADQGDITQIARGSYIAQAAAGGTAMVVHYKFAPPAPIDASALADAAVTLGELPVSTVPPVAALPQG